MASPCGVVLLNAGSGASRGAKNVAHIRTRVESYGSELIIPDSAEAMEAEAARAVVEGRPLIAVGGGDDTVRSALWGMQRAGYFEDEDVRQRTAFAILPQGTFNNFATYLGIPSDFEEALRIAHMGETRWVDLGLAGGKVFTESVSVGIDVAAWKEFPVEHPKLLRRIWDGFMAVTRALLVFRPRKYSLWADGTHTSLRAYSIMVANSDRFSAAFSVAPHAIQDDGCLDLCIIPSLSKLGFLMAVPLIFTGKHTSYLRGVRYSKVRRVHLAPNKPRQCTFRVDARLHQSSSIEIVVLPRVLPIRAPEGPLVSSGSA